MKHKAKRFRRWGGMHFFREWEKAHPEFCQPTKPPRVIPDTYNTLHVWNEYFEADCRWKRSMGTWICIEAQPPILWMKGMDRATAKLEIARMGLNYKWILPAGSTESKPSTPAGVV